MPTTRSRTQSRALPALLRQPLQVAAGIGHIPKSTASEQAWNLVLAATLTAVTLIGDGCSAPPRFSQRLLESTEQCADPKSFTGRLRISPVGLAGPVVRSIGGWAGYVPSGEEIVGWRADPSQPTTRTFQVQLLVAVVGPSSQVVALARRVRRQSDFQLLADVKDPQSHEWLSGPGDVGIHLREFSGVDLEAPVTQWDAKRLAEAHHDYQDPKSIEHFALSIAVIRVDFREPPPIDQPLLVSLEPLQRALESTFNGVPVVVDTRPVELMIREP